MNKEGKQTAQKNAERIVIEATQRCVEAYRIKDAEQKQADGKVLIRRKLFESMMDRLEDAAYRSDYSDVDSTVKKIEAMLLDPVYGDAIAEYAARNDQKFIYEAMNRILSYIRREQEET